jgi:hypothetical protein
MKRTAALVLMACSLAGCDTSVDDPRSSARPQALLMINNSPSALNSTVNTLYNGVVALSAAREISASIASALTTPLAEIKGDGPYYHSVSPTAAIRKLQDFISLANRNHPAQITLCAHTNLIRGAEFLIDAIEWSATNGGAVRPADSALPWGVCPWPVPVSNLSVVNNGATADVSFYYEPNANYFWIFQVLPDGTLSQLLGEIDSNDGVSGGDGAPTGGTRSFTVPVTADPNLKIMVRTCGGLHCVDQNENAVHLGPSAPPPAEPGCHVGGNNRDRMKCKNKGVD